MVAAQISKDRGLHKLCQSHFVPSEQQQRKLCPGVPPTCVGTFRASGCPPKIQFVQTARRIATPHALVAGVVAIANGRADSETQNAKTEERKIGKCSVCHQFSSLIVRHQFGLTPPLREVETSKNTAVPDPTIHKTTPNPCATDFANESCKTVMYKSRKARAPAATAKMTRSPTNGDLLAIRAEIATAAMRPKTKIELGSCGPAQLADRRKFMDRGNAS